MTSLKAGLSEESYSEAEDRQSTDLGERSPAVSPNVQGGAGSPQTHTELTAIQMQGKCCVAQPGTSNENWTVSCVF